jgi:hypothetical protein
MFRDTASILESRGVPVIHLDTSRLAPEEAAARIADAADGCCASLTGHG